MGKYNVIAVADRKTGTGVIKLALKPKHDLIQ